MSLANPSSCYCDSQSLCDVWMPFLSLTQQQKLALSKLEANVHRWQLPHFQEVEESLPSPSFTFRFFLGYVCKSSDIHFCLNFKKKQLWWESMLYFSSICWKSNVRHDNCKTNKQTKTKIEATTCGHLKSSPGCTCRWAAVPGDLLLHPAGQIGWLNDHVRGGEQH